MGANHNHHKTLRNTFEKYIFELSFRVVKMGKKIPSNFCNVHNSIKGLFISYYLQDFPLWVMFLKVIHGNTAKAFPRAKKGLT